ncbi:MAG: iron chelate uptake ABC transporter family permease subunit, partial [Flavobacteriales bacterium]
KKSDHRLVIPFTLLTGASLGLICDIISRLPGLDGSLPLNAVTSFIGAPIVVWIIFKNKMV